MKRNLWITAFTLSAGLLILNAPLSAAPAAKSKAAADAATAEGEKVFWRDPVDITSRNLLYGQGGTEHQPASNKFDFDKEDTSASTAKFSVHEADGTKWKIKLGDEARPETVATRLVWAAGFVTDEDYYMPDVVVTALPAHVHRGKQFIGENGAMRGARLEREISGQKKIGIWKWRQDAFTGTREWNGLRALMALMNNWDLKDVNNGIYEVAGSAGAKSAFLYVVTDLGATFGPEHLDMARNRDKGDLKTFSHTRFLSKVRPEEVSFRVPGSPSPFFIFVPWVYIHRRNLMWLGHDIPRQDAHWMGTVLARLSPEQIRDAFRAGGYSPTEVDAYAVIIEKRIADLVAL